MSQSNEPLSKARPSLVEVLEHLGQPMATFAPSGANLVAGIIIGILCLGGGIALMVGAALKGEGTTIALGIVAGLFLAAVGVVGIILMPMLFSLRILVCPEGLVRVSGKKVEAFPWEKIIAVTESRSEDHSIGGRNYTVSRQDGVELFFDANAVRGVSQLAQLIQEETSKRRIPWRIA